MSWHSYNSFKENSYFQRRRLRFRLNAFIHIHTAKEGERFFVKRNTMKTFQNWFLYCNVSFCAKDLYQGEKISKMSSSNIWTRIRSELGWSSVAGCTFPRMCCVRWAGRGVESLHGNVSIFLSSCAREDTVMTTCPFPLLLGYFLHGFSHLDPSARARSRPTDPTIVKTTNSSIFLWIIYLLNINIKYVKTHSSF